jgi:hypothetical protein
MLANGLPPSGEVQSFPTHWSMERAELKLVTHAGSSLKYQVLLTKLPVFVSNQYAPSAMRPAGSTALRSLLEMPITFDLPLAIFSSSPKVLTSSLRGDEPRPGLPPSSCVCSSETLVTCLPASRSNHSLPTIPLTDGVAPLSMVAWPIAVTVGKCS